MDPVPEPDNYGGSVDEPGASEPPNPPHYPLSGLSASRIEDIQYNLLNDVDFSWMDEFMDWEPTGKLVPQLSPVTSTKHN